MLAEPPNAVVGMAVWFTDGFSQVLRSVKVLGFILLSENT